MAFIAQQGVALKTTVCAPPSIQPISGRSHQARCMPIAVSLGKKRTRFARGPPNIVLDIGRQAVLCYAPAPATKVTTMSLQDVMLGFVIRLVSLAP